MYRPLSYALKIWGTALLVCPFIVTAYQYFTYSGYEQFAMIPILIFFGAICSFPSMLLLWLAIHLLRDWDAENYLYQKQALSIICTVLSGLPFFLLIGGSPLDLICFIAVYAAGTIAGVWIYNLHPKEEHANDEQETINQEPA